MTDSATSDSQRDPLDLLAEEYLGLHRTGAAPSVEIFAAGHSEHGDELRDILHAMLALEGVKQDHDSTASSQRRPQVPQLERLGDYRILREIGRGGMGVVFEAVQESLGRRVALKVLPSQALASERQLERFRREAKTAARLHHSNIVPVFGSGDADGYHYFAMQFIDGQGLDRVITEQARVTASTDVRERCRFAARVGAQAAGALHHAHQHGVLHRDVKPSNLLLDREQNVWVTDFGLAKALEAEGLTLSGDVLGTLQYMAPEQFEGRYDERTEVYALGLTVYEVLAGGSAFRGSNRGEIVDRIRHGRKETIEARLPGIPRDLATIVHKATAIEASDRYADAGALQEDLERFLEDRPILGRRVSSAEQLVRFCRRNKALAGTAAVAIAAVVIAAVVGWTYYAIADSARADAQDSAVKERAANALADTNLQLALQAFEDVFEGIVGPDPFHAIVEDPDTGDLEASVLAPVDPRDAAMLERMLAFYDRFAAANAANVDLREQTARAHRRVGVIHGRLGDLEAAERSFERSLAIYRGISDQQTRIEVAVVYLELGQVMMRGDRPGEAVEQFHTARKLLVTDPPDPSPRARYELARAHYLLAKAPELRRARQFGRGGQRPDSRGERRPDRQGGRPSFWDDPRWDQAFEELRQHFAEARRLVDGLLAEGSDNPDLLLMNARLLADEGRPGFGRRGAQAQLREAIAVLDGLVARFPGAEIYRFELFQIYDFLDMVQGRPGGAQPADPAAAVADARTGLGHARRLVELAPAKDDYLACLARGRSRLGDALLRAEKPALALPEFQASVQTYQQLAAGNESDPRWAMRQVGVQTQVARCLFATGERDQARREALAAVARLRALASQWQAAEGRPLRLSVDRFARVLDEVGATDEAERLRAEFPSERRGGR